MLSLKSEQFHVLLLFFTTSRWAQIKHFRPHQFDRHSNYPNTYHCCKKKVGIESFGAAVALVVVVVDQLYDDDGHEAPFAPQIFFTKARGKEAFSILTPTQLHIKQKC